MDIEAADPKSQDMSLGRLAARLASREVCSQDIAQVYIDRIENLDGALNAFEAIDKSAVMVAARQADAAAAKGQSLGLLHGLPVAFKANIDVLGYATTGSSRALAQHIPSKDADIVAAMKSQGMIPMGKLNMHELAFGATSNNSYCKAVRNPFDNSVIPGGSSGGSGAAVGGSLVPATLGTDTGGSVRVPAALCGAAGLRPSTGRWSTRGILPISHTRDTPGPIAQCVGDLDLLDRAVVDPRREAASPTSLSGLRFGLPTGYYFETLTDDVRIRTEQALQILVDAGVTLVELSHADFFREVEADGMMIALWEFRADVERYLEGTGIALDTVLDEIASPDVAGVAEIIRSLGDEARNAYSEIIATKRPAWQSRIAGIFDDQKLDATVFPMVCTTAPKVGLDDNMEINGETLPVFGTLVRNAAVGSVLGLPGLALPNGVGQNGLPVSLGLDSQHGQDTRLLSIGLAVEDALIDQQQ
jgi:mandelamide amidase